MLKLLTRGLRARWTRYLLSAVAIAIGVALVAGTVILARSARAEYSDLTRRVSSGIDIYVRGPETDVRQGISDFAPESDALLQRVRTVPGVADAQGQVVRVGQLVTVAGRFLQPNRPTYVYSWIDAKELLPFAINAGRAPRAAGEVVVSRATARAEGLGIGDAIRVSVNLGSPRPARIVGLVRPRTGGDLTGADAVFVSAAWAQDLTGIGDRWDLIDVVAAPGVSVDSLRSRIRAVVPDDRTSVVTAAEYNSAQLANFARRSSSLNAILLSLSLLAFAVASGVAYNTFSILVAQRTSELSLLRTVGMARAQVRLMVLGEGVFVGLVGSAAGALAALPAAHALRRLTLLSSQAVRVDELRFSPGIAVAAAVLGTLVCVAVSVVPARRASRVAPVAAWRDAQPAVSASMPRILVILPVVVALVGVILLAISVFASDAGSGLDAAGAVIVVIALLIALPVYAPTFLRALGAIVGRTGAAGAVAGTSAAENPRRVVAPILALVLGLGMVTSVAVVAASAHAAMSQLVSRADRADLVIVSDAAPGIDVESIEKLIHAPDVRVVSELGEDTFDRDGHGDQFTALDTDSATIVFNLPVESGTLANFSDGDIAVTRAAARRWGYRVGDFIAVRFDLPQRRFLRIAAVVADNGITHDWVIPFETYRRGFFKAPIRALFIKGTEGVDAATLRREVDVGVDGFPGVSVLEPRTYAQQQAVKAEGPIALVQSLVALSVVVALLGVANALSLSVLERGWEFGLLDVLGMTPAQVSLTVQWEAVFIALAGVVFGVGAGLVLGLGLAHAAGVDGFTRLTVPFGTIVGVSSVVVVVAFIASVFPARRAVRDERNRNRQSDCVIAPTVGSRRMKRFLAFVGGAAAIALIAAGCSSTLSDAATIDYSEGGTNHTASVSRDELLRDVRKLAANKPFASWLMENGFAVNSDVSTASSLSAIWLSQLIQQHAVDQLFDARHLEVSPAIKAQAAQDVVANFPNDAVYRAFDPKFRATLAERQARVEALFASYTDTSDAAGRKFFDEHRSQFACASGRNVAHILVTSPTAARGVLDALARGESFAALARQHSTDTQTAVQGGALGCLTPREFLTAFQRAAETAPFDTPTGPVRSQYGYHIILVTHATPSYDASRLEVRQALVQAGQEAGQRSIDRRLASFKVHVDPRFGSWGLASDGQGQRVYQVSPPAALRPRTKREGTTTLPAAGAQRSDGTS